MKCLTTEFDLMFYINSDLPNLGTIMQLISEMSFILKYINNISNKLYNKALGEKKFKIAWKSVIKILMYLKL